MDYKFIRKPAQENRDKLFVVHESIMDWLGMWPLTPKTSLRRLLGPFAVFFIILFHIATMIFYEFRNRDDWTKVSYSVPEQLKHWIDFIKFLAILYYRQAAVDVIEDLSGTWKTYTQFDFPGWKEKQVRAIRLTEVVSWLYIAYYFYACFNVFYVPTILSTGWALINGRNLTNDLVIPPMLMEYPWDMHSDYWTAFFTHNGVITFSLVFTTRLASAIYALYISMISLTSNLFNCIQMQLHHLDLEWRDAFLAGKETYDEKRVSRQLGSIINQHNHVYEIVRKLETIMSEAMLGIYMLGSLTLTFVIFRYVTLNQYTDYFHMFTHSSFAAAIYLDIFLVSFCGDQLMQAADDVTFAAYSTCWYHLKPRHQRAILLIIQRAQRPTGMTASKFYFINFESFATVLHNSFRYLTLLRTLFHKSLEEI